MERRIFPKGKDGIGKAGGVVYEDMRWSRLKNQDPATMFETVSEHVFPFLRTMADADTDLIMRELDRLMRKRRLLPPSMRGDTKLAVVAGGKA